MLPKQNNPEWSSSEYDTGNKGTRLRSDYSELLDVVFKEYFSEIELIEPDDVGFAGQFFVDGVWYSGKYGCDSLQMFIDKLRSI